MITQPAYRKKLIEVDLPLDAINAESAREKSIRHGHPSTLHMWWARRPLASCRAVIFASLVDDPAACPEEFPTLEAQALERERLHSIIRRLVRWETTDASDPQNLDLLSDARWEIARSVARSRSHAAPNRNNRSEVLAYLKENSLPLYDPFCGGGSIPLEAQRLGLKAIGSDLNPVAVLLTKALIELPPKFAAQAPVNPAADPMGITRGKGKNAKKIPWRGADGLADDVRYYGRWIRDAAWERIGTLFPTVKLPSGSEATVIAWLWARTIPCPNPACGIDIPLMRTFQLSTKQSNRHWVKPTTDEISRKILFQVQSTEADVPVTSTMNGRDGAVCFSCLSTVPMNYIRDQSHNGTMSKTMTAIVAEGKGKRLFLSPSQEHIQASDRANPTWQPPQPMPDSPTLVSGRGYHFNHWHQLFTDRQLACITTFCDLVKEARDKAIEDGATTEYANAIQAYLALSVGRMVGSNSEFTVWNTGGEKIEGVFSRQAVPMTWDFPETNPFSSSTKNWTDLLDGIAKVIERLPPNPVEGEVHQADATTTIHVDKGPVIVTDPPYYDNIDYADLSDYFYVWLRSVLRDTYPELFAGMLTPKDQEMTAIPGRFADPQQRFEDLLGQTLELIRERCSPEFPSSIFYAYKQQEEEREGRSSTGWETMLSAVVNAGFEVVGTWPMRTERMGGVKARANVLASSVVLVCRPREETALTATRRQFLDALERELPAALDHLTREGHIAPVDLAQAAIGPGMQIYSRYSRVETIGGEPVPVREALAHINRVIAEYDEQAQGELDRETRFCIDWIKQYGHSTGEYGQAEDLARAKGTAVSSLRDNHRLLEAGFGDVNLLIEDDYGPNRRQALQEMTAWEGCFRMTYHLDPSREDGAGIDGAATVARAMGSNADSVERLARILYNHYDRKGDSRNSVKFNNLVTEWPQILQRAQDPGQGRLV